MSPKIPSVLKTRRKHLGVLFTTFIKEQPKQKYVLKKVLPCKASGISSKYEMLKCNNHSKQLSIQPFLGLEKVVSGSGFGLSKFYFFQGSLFANLKVEPYF